MVSLAERRHCVAYLLQHFKVGERRACQVAGIHRSSYRYQGQQEQKDHRYQRVIVLSKRYPYWGYRKMYDLMKMESLPISRERVRLIRRQEGLQVLKKRRKRRALGNSTHWVNRAQFPCHVWSYDFIFDQTMDARQLKCLVVVDEFTRECLTIEVNRSLTAHDVVRVLEKLFSLYGQPLCIRSDNGPELISAKVRQWLKDKCVETHYISPGSPWENAYTESFNSIFRQTCLDRWLFSSLTEARVIINQWLQEYNEIRPHGSLNGKSPSAFKQERLNQICLTNQTLTG